MENKVPVWVYVALAVVLQWCAINSVAVHLIVKRQDWLENTMLIQVQPFRLKAEVEHLKQYHEVKDGE